MTKNIAKAYEAEMQYYKDKDRLHSNVLDIMDYIGPCGYDTYEEYWNDVQEYKFKTTNYEIIEAEDIAEDVYLNHIKTRTPAFFYLINSSNNYAFVPQNFKHDEIFEEYNIIPAHMTYIANNGIIITSNGDLRVVIISYDVKYPIENLLIKLKNYLLNYFNNVVVDNNDILIDNKKICGSGFMTINGMNVYMFQITFVDRVDLIKKICKNSIKEPGYIDPNIVSQYKLKDEFISWLRL